MRLVLAKGAGILVLIALIIGLAVWADSTTSNSTQGVTVVGDNLARLPYGEDFVLTRDVSCGSGCYSTEVWHITYDGKRTVNFDEEGFLFISGDHHQGTLCGVNCSVNVGMGWLDDSMTIKLRPDGAAEVQWPYGWDYRPYKK